MTIRSFTKSINDPLARNEWVKYGTDYCMDVYISSRGKRVINGRIWDHVLTIGNVVIQSERMKNKGEFRRFNAWMQQKAKVHNYDFIYIENILNPILERALLRYGYKHIDEMHHLTPCMVYPISPEARNAYNERYSIGQHAGNASNDASGNRRSDSQRSSKREVAKRAETYSFGSR